MDSNTAVRDVGSRDPPRMDRAFALVMLAIILGVLATSLPQTGVLGLIPLKNLLKNALGASREQTAAFFFWIALPWYFKPLLGALQDLVPLGGGRRRGWLLLSALLAALAWWGLAFAPRNYPTLLWVCLGVNLALVSAVTAVGAYLVEVARSSASAGRLSAVRSVVEQAGFVLSGPLAGWLAGIAFGWTAVACGAIAFVGVPVALWLVREAPLAVAPGGGTRPRAFLLRGNEVFSGLLRARPLWLAALVALLFYFAPGTDTARFYAEQNDLHLDTRQQGTILFLAGSAGVLAAALYGVFAVRRLTLRWLLVVCLALGAGGQAAFVFYTSWDAARVVAALNGFGPTLADLALLHLAVRATPRGSEALGFALLMAVRNVGLYGGDWLGAAIQDHWHLRFHTLALLNAGVSLLAIPLCLLLPAALVDVRDARGPRV